MTFGSSLPSNHDPNEPQKKDTFVISDRIKNALQTCSDVKEYYRLRAQIEQDYGERLLQLKHLMEGYGEQGTLADSLSQIPTTLELTARAHIDLGDQVRHHLEKPMESLLIEHREEGFAQQQRIDSSRQLKETYHANVLRVGQRQLRW
ncbi:hypothetical protein F4703DRAFT_1220052 [Phycomyces blakesleeanus]